MARSKSRIALENRLSGLKVGIDAYHAADSDSTEALLAKKAALEKISVESTNVLLEAYKEAMHRIKELSNRLQNLTTKHRQREQDIHLHEKFVGRLATQMLGLNYELEDLRRTQSPHLADALTVANFKFYELTRSAQQLDGMKRACAWSKEVLGRLMKRSVSTRDEELRGLPASSQLLIDKAETMLDGVMEELARRSWGEGDGEPGAEIDERDEAGEPGAETNGDLELREPGAAERDEDEAGEQEAEECGRTEKEEPVSPFRPTRPPAQLTMGADLREQTTKGTKPMRTAVAACLAKSYAFRWKRVKKMW